MNGVPRRRPSWPVIALRAAWRLVRWPLLGAALLALSSAIAFQMGAWRFERAGRPNDFARENSMQELRMMVAEWSAYRYRSDYPMNLTLDVPETQFINGARPWQSKDHHKLARNKSAIIYQTDRRGTVTRYNMVLNSVDGHFVQSLMLCLSSAHQPDALAGAIDSDQSIYEVSVWRMEKLILTVEVRREGLDEYAVIINGIGTNDPRYKTRWQNGGLSPATRHLQEIIRQLNLTQQERAKERQSVPQLPPSPFLEWQ